MNDAGRKAIEHELGQVRDNLHRYRVLGRPEDPVGGGPQTVADTIKALESEEQELLAALEDLATSM
jgi:transcriptional regulator of NAD metabolism